jgi:Peptidase family M1 domain
MNHFAMKRAHPWPDHVQKRPLLLALATILVLSTLVGGPATQVARAAEQAPAASYRLDATADLGAGRVETTEVVRYRNVLGVPLTSLVFRVVPNVVGTFELRQATVDGLDVAPSLDGSVLELPLARPLVPSATVEIALAFTIHPPETRGRLAATSRGMALGNWFPILAVRGEDWDRRQYVDIGDAFFSEVADYDLALATTTPAQVVATGRRVEAEGRRVHYVATGVRDLAVAISPNYVVKASTVGSTTFTAATFGQERSTVYLERGAEFVRWLGEKFGTYPYPSLVMADMDLPASYGGMEYPGLVMLAPLGVESPVEGSTLDRLLLHEIAHQWFYSQVGDDEIDDPWMDEALAWYVIYAYYQEVRPDLAGMARENVMNGAGSGYVDAGVNDFPPNADAAYYSVVYRRGSRFLEELRGQLGDGPFWSLLRDHVAVNRNRIATPRAFLDRAQRASAASLNPLFAKYFSYGSVQPPMPPRWNVDAPDSPWSGSVHLFVSAEFPVTRVQVWLDQRIVADGQANDLTLDLGGVEPGEYVLLTRVWDHESVLFERSRRIEVTR